MKRATAVLGAPAFNGNNDSSGLFEDEDGYAFAMWRLDTARLIVMARNEGPDTPVWISIAQPSAVRCIRMANGACAHRHR